MNLKAALKRIGALVMVLIMLLGLVSYFPRAVFAEDEIVEDYADETAYAEDDVEEDEFPIISEETERGVEITDEMFDAYLERLEERELKKEEKRENDAALAAEIAANEGRLAEKEPEQEVSLPDEVNYDAPKSHGIPTDRAPYGDGESCFWCDGYLDYTNCCQGCGGVHATGECYEKTHCDECGACFLNEDFCAECRKCLNCCDYVCSVCEGQFHPRQDEYCTACGMCIVCAIDECMHCNLCLACDASVCDGCGLCIDCQEEQFANGGGHCPSCGACMYDEFGSISNENLCPEHGDEHCKLCYEESFCEQCEACAVDDGLCTYCNLCPDCCEENSIDEGCTGEMCREDPEFDFHFCENCGQCYHESPLCEDCGEWCEDCCDAERCDVCGLCPNVYYFDTCDTCGAGGDDLSEHMEYHECEDNRCGLCGFCHNALETEYGYYECPCCGSCPNECTCDDDCPDCDCHKISGSVSVLFSNQQMNLTVYVTETTSGDPVEGANVYYSRDKKQWKRLGVTDSDGVATGNVIRFLNGDRAERNLSGWYVSYTKGSSKLTKIQIGDAYYIPWTPTSAVTFKSTSNRDVFTASTTLKMTKSTIKPSDLAYGQYDLVISLPKNSSGFVHSLTDSWNMYWSQGKWDLWSYETDKNAGWWDGTTAAQRQQLRMAYMKANSNYFGAYLIPYDSDSNLPSTNTNYYFTPLYKLDLWGNMKSCIVNEGLTRVAHSIDGDYYTRADILRFDRVKAGKYQLFIILPECKLYSQRVDIDFGYNDTFGAQTYKELTMSQAVRPDEKKKNYSTIQIETQRIRPGGGGTYETTPLYEVLGDGADHQLRAMFLLTYADDGDSYKKTWVVNEPWSRSGNDPYKFVVPKSANLSFMPYVITADSWDMTHPDPQGRYRTDETYCYLSQNVGSTKANRTINIAAVKSKNAPNNPNEGKYYKLKVKFNEVITDDSGKVLSRGLMPNTADIRFRIADGGGTGNYFVYTNQRIGDIEGLKGWYNGKQNAARAIAKLGAFQNKFHYTNDTRNADGGWVTIDNSCACFDDGGALLGISGNAYCDGYGATQNVISMINSTFTRDESTKTYYMEFTFYKLTRSAMKSAYGANTVEAKIHPDSYLSRLNPQIVYVNGSSWKATGVVPGDEVTIKFTTASKEFVRGVTFERDGSSLELKSVTNDTKSAKKTYEYTFKMGYEAVVVYVDVGWPDGDMSSWDPYFVRPSSAYTIDCYVGEKVNIIAEIGGDFQAMEYKDGEWIYNGTISVDRRMGTTGSWYYRDQFKKTHNVVYPVYTDMSGTYQYRFHYSTDTYLHPYADSAVVTVNVMTPFEIDKDKTKTKFTITEGESVNLPFYWKNVRPDDVQTTWDFPSQDVNGDGVYGDQNKVTMDYNTFKTTKNYTPLGTYLIRRTETDKWGHTATVGYYVTVKKDTRWSHKQYCAAKPILNYSISLNGKTDSGTKDTYPWASGTSLSYTMAVGEKLDITASWEMLPKGNAYYYKYLDADHPDTYVWKTPLVGETELNIQYYPVSDLMNYTLLYKGSAASATRSFIPTEPGEYEVYINISNEVRNFLRENMYESDYDYASSGLLLKVTVTGGLRGDVNGDGEVTMKDVLLLRRYIAGLSELDDAALARADLNGDGDATMKDVLILRRIIAGLES